MKRTFLLILLVSLIMSCNDSINLGDEFLIYQSGKLSIQYRDEVYNINEYSQNHPASIDFDNRRHNLWISYLDNPNICFVNVFEKNTEHICIELEEEPYSNWAIDDNHVILIFENGSYGILDLLKQKIEYLHDEFPGRPISINEVEGLFKIDKGFLYKNFQKNIEHSTMISLSFYNYQSEMHKVIGIDKEDNITIVDILDSSINRLPIKRKLNYSKYNYHFPSFYYLDSNFLYYSQDKNGFLDGFPLSEPAKYKWFRYNLKTGENIRINMPTDSSEIIGKIEK